MNSAAPSGPKPFDWVLEDAWPLLLGFAVLAGPTLLSLADKSWSRESGAQGPIILFTGGWLLWRRLPELRRLATPGTLWLTAGLMAPALLAYIFGRAFDNITLEAGGLFGVALAMVQAKIGERLMLRNWFPFFYLAFAVPPPSIWIDMATAPLKRFASFAATDILHAFGLPVVHEGVTIFVAQYQLLVKDACSGMNSIIGLLAISLFYIYVMRGSSWRYALFLTTLTIPIAIIANVLRIMVLISLTYYFGDEVAQGFLHVTAGLFVFVAALVLIFALDHLIFFVMGKFRRHA